MSQPYGNIKISENIIAASKLNLLRGCRVISELKLLFKHNLIKSLFLSSNISKLR